MKNEDYTRVLNTADLKTLNKRARNLGMNRGLSPSLEKDLDPNGTHVMFIELYGHNMDANPDKIHHRCRVLTKVRNQHEPVEGLIDVLDEDFQRLMSRSEAAMS